MNFPVVHPKSLIGRAYEILNLQHGGAVSKDSQTSVRQIMRAIESAYAEVVNQDMKERVNTGLQINPQIGFEYNCVPLKEKESKCGISGCSIKTIDIPVMAEYAGMPAVFGVGTDGIQFKKVNSAQEAKSVTSAKKFSPGRPAYVVKSKSLDVYLSPSYNEVCQISWWGIPEKPSSESSDCFDIWSEEYPMLEHLWERTKRIVLGVDSESILRTEQFRDKVNDRV